jgi:transposase-like protein
MIDLKRVYAAPTEDIAISELDLFDDKWGGKYPKIAKSWWDNWANLSTYFKYPSTNCPHPLFYINLESGKTINKNLRSILQTRFKL